MSTVASVFRCGIVVKDLLVMVLNDAPHIYIFRNCARSLEYSSSSTLAGLSYHICGKLEVAFKASPSSQHQHCTDEAQDFSLTFSAG